MNSYVTGRVSLIALMNGHTIPNRNTLMRVKI